MTIAVGSGRVFGKQPPYIERTAKRYEAFVAAAGEACKQEFDIADREHVAELADLALETYSGLLDAHARHVAAGETNEAASLVMTALRALHAADALVFRSAPSPEHTAKLIALTTSNVPHAELRGFAIGEAVRADVTGRRRLALTARRKLIAEGRELPPETAGYHIPGQGH
jgi:hypothetical protein